MRPFVDEHSLFRSADLVWAEMGEVDWIEAFAAHPRIGDRQAPHGSTQSTAWSREEQSTTALADSEVTNRLAAFNRRYEESYGFTYIVCATGKTAEEMLDILERRLSSDRDSELREAAEQQRQIMQIRLRKWLLP
jgi:OHCU decarboxylase